MTYRSLVLAGLVLLAPRAAAAANLVARADGGLTAAATWALADATGSLVSTSTATTALTTSSLDSATFTPGAITVDGFVVRLAARAAGVATNTLTLTLRNATGAVDVQTCVINVADLPVTDTTNDQGGWIFCRFNTSATLAAATAYAIRASLSATSTAVSLSTNGTANNWQRLLVTATTQAPAAGDDLHVAGAYVNSSSPATFGARVVTMESTAATDYGSANTDARVAGLNLSKGGTLTYATAASTAYTLRLSGSLVLFSGGTLAIGTVATPIPRTSSAVLEFDNPSAGAFGLYGRDGSVTRMQGESPVAGSSATWALLNTNEAAGQTVLGVDRQLAAPAGGEIIVTPTTRNFTDTDVRTLSGAPGASSLTVTAGLTRAHDGVAPFQAEVASLTRNVTVRAVTAAGDAFLIWKGAADVDIDWVLFRYLGNNAAVKLGLALEHTSGALSIAYSVVRDQEIFGFVVGPETGTGGGTTEIAHNVIYKVNTGDTQAPIYVRPSARAASIVDNVIIPENYMRAITISGGAQWTAIAQNRICCSNIGIWFGPTTDETYEGQPALEDNVIHSLNQYAIFSDVMIRHHVTFDGLDIWRCTSCAFHTVGQPYRRLTVRDFRFTGNACGLNLGSPNITYADILFENGQIAGDTSNATSQAFNLNDGTHVKNLQFRNVDFGVSSGVYVPMSSSDLLISGASTYMSWDLLLVDVALRATTEIQDNTVIHNPSSQIRAQAADSATRHFVRTHYGIVEATATGCDAGRCLELRPNLATATYKLASSGLLSNDGWRIPVATGNVITVSIKGKKSAAYNGNAARLMIKPNPAIGIDAELVCDTHTAAAGTFETLTCTAPAVTADGFVEVYVDVDGTLGAYTVDTLAVTGSVTLADGLEAWANGLPVLAAAGAGGTATPVEVSTPFFH